MARSLRCGYVLILMILCGVPALAGADEKGWTDLTTQGMDAFKAPWDKWTRAESVMLDPANPKKLVAKPGGVILVNGPTGRIPDLVTKQSYSDLDVQLDFLIAKGSNSGVKLHGLYEIQILDSHGRKDLTGDSCGGVYPRAELKPKYHHIDKGVPPRTNAAKPAGEWQTLHISFLAPRFGPDGKKTANARFVRVVLNGTVIHENVELLWPTGHAWKAGKEVAQGPLLLQADHGPVAFRNVRIRPRSQPVSGHEQLRHWHQWRGPLMNGFAPHADPPLSWDDKTNVKWKTPLPGPGASTPIIWGDRVFVLAARDTQRQADPKDIPKPDARNQPKTKPPTTYHLFLVLCLERATGKVLWQRTAAEAVPHEGHHETHSYAAGSPTTDGQFLYVSFGSRGLFCYDLDGNLKWQRDLGRQHTRYGWGEAVSPAIHGDTVIVNWDNEFDSFVIALDAKTGATKWKQARDEPTSWATPLIVTHQGRTQVIVNATNRVRSYDLTTGEVLWQCGGMTTNAIPSPVVVGDHLVCMSGYRGSMAWAVPLDATGDITDSPKVAWRHDRGTPYVPSPLLYEGKLYFTQGNTGMLTVLDAKTGKPLLEQARLPGLSSLYASPVGAAGRVYFTGRDGTTVVLRATAKLEVLATNRLGTPVDASPALVGKQMFLRGREVVYCIESP